MLSVVKYVYKYVHTYICNIHMHTCIDDRYDISKPKCLLGGGFTVLLLCKLGIPVGSTTSMKLQLQPAKETFCRWIFWGFYRPWEEWEGKEVVAVPFGFSCPCFCGSCTPFLGVSRFLSCQKLAGLCRVSPYTLEHTSLWPWAYINASQDGIAGTCWLGIRWEPLEQEEDSGTNALQESDCHILSLDIIQLAEKDTALKLNWLRPSLSV